MANYYDYKTDPATGNLVIDANTGDFAITESTGQELEELLISEPGEYGQSLLVGVGIKNWLNASFTHENVVAAKKRIKQQIEGDGMTENQTQLGGFDKIRIDAERA